MKNDNKIDFAVGGQAVLEGIMMRSPNYIVIAVRNDKGEIVTSEEKFESIVSRLKVKNIPIIRGIFGMIEALYIGTKALNFSSNVQLNADTSESKSSFQELFVSIFGILAGLGLALFLFKWLPLFITDLLQSYIEVLANSWVAFNIVDGLLKTIFFLTYLVLIAKMPDIYRVFQYHGAEHKSIATYEAELELTVKNAKNQTRFHPRCGTSFIIFVILVSIIVYSFIPTHSEFILRFLERILLLPLIAGISYEVLKYSAKHSESKLVGWLIKPGLLVQRITTKEPDEKQLEVGLHALKRALELERGEV